MGLRYVATTPKCAAVGLAVARNLTQNSRGALILRQLAQPALNPVDPHPSHEIRARYILRESQPQCLLFRTIILAASCAVERPALRSAKGQTT
jgi:hypothetical protein